MRIVLRSIFEDFGEMATTGKGKGSKEAASFTGDYQFVNLSLSDEQQENALAAYSDIDFVWESVVVLLRAGYKLSLSFDERSDSFCASLSGVRCGKPNEGRVLTGWADNEFDAMRFVLYKHTTVLDMNWSKGGKPDQRRG